MKEIDKDFFNSQLKVVELDLPYPPSCNTRMKIQRGKWILTPEARNYYENIRKTLILKRKNYQITQNLSLIIIRYCDNRKDIDNFLKCLLDALEKANFYKNDRQIKNLQIITRSKKGATEYLNLKFFIHKDTKLVNNEKEFIENVKKQ